MWPWPSTGSRGSARWRSRPWSLVLGTEDPPKVAAPAEVPRLVVSRSRPPEFIPALAERLGATTVAMGSAGAKIASVIRGESEIYVHAGGQFEWDSAAPVAVALASGLHASRLDGSPLRYSQPDPWMPDLVVCHPALTAAVMDALGAVGPTGGRMTRCRGCGVSARKARRSSRPRPSSSRPGSVRSS